MLKNAQLPKAPPLDPVRGLTAPPEPPAALNVGASPGLYFIIYNCICIYADNLEYLKENMLPFLAQKWAFPKRNATYGSKLHFLSKNGGLGKG